MNLSAAYAPDPADLPAPAAEQPAGHGWLDTATGIIDTIPGWVWPIAFTTGFLAVLAITIAAVRRHRAGKTADKLLVLAFAAAVGFWFATLIGSFRGLVAFGRDTLHWHDGWQYLVPLTLDGVAVSFALLAAVALKRHRPIERSYRVVWTATVASAVINFVHEYNASDGDTSGGFYLALLSYFAMMLLHQLLDLFGEATARVVRIKPVFGLRWFTWPSNTVCAWLAWQNHPPQPLPAKPTDEQRIWYASVRHAVAHLETVRRAKRIASHTRAAAAAVLPAPWWASAAPWQRVRQLSAALDVAGAERREMSARFAAVEAEHAERIAARDADLADLSARMEQITAEHRSAVADAARNAERYAEAEAERDAAEQRAKAAERDAETARSEAVERVDRARSEMAERLHRMQLEHTEQVAALRPEPAKTAGRGGRSNVTPIRRSASAVKPANPMGTDDGALAAMFAEHPEPDFTWTDREVNRITGAGFSSRAPRLTGLASEHQRSCPVERHAACFGGARSASTDDDQEDSFAASNAG